MTIKFIVDSASDISREEAQQYNAFIVPLYVSFHGDTYKEDFDFDLTAYYQQYIQGKIRPRTSQPSPADFMQMYEQAVEEGAEDIIVITISSGLSGTYNSARVAAESFKEFEEDINIYLVDSRSASYPSVFLLQHGVKLAETGMNAQDIAVKLQEMAYQIKTYIYLPTLKYLHQSGRISAAKYFLGTLLKKKPITRTNKEGKNEVVTTVSSDNEGYHTLLQLTTENFTRTPTQVAIIHTWAQDKAEALQAIIKEKYPDLPITIRLSGTIISAHTGPGSIALISDFNE